MSRILSMNEYYIKNSEENILYKKFKDYCEMYKDKIEEESNKSVSYTHLTLPTIYSV